MNRRYERASAVLTSGTQLASRHQPVAGAPFLSYEAAIDPARVGLAMLRSAALEPWFRFR